jgi:putative transcriptional regulator
MNRDMIKPRLVEMLEEKGKTLYWLAKETETAYSTIHKLSNAKTDSISFRVLDRICAVLDCDPGDILVRVNEQAESRPKVAKKTAKKGGATK